jgi:multidrug resistance efflux pump
MRRIVPILLILAVIGGGTYWWSQQQTQAATGLKGSGTIEVEQINLGPEVSGRVIQVLAEEGQPVTAGQVLFRLDDTLLKAQRTQAEAAVNTARAQRDQLVAGARPEQLAAAQAAISSTLATLSGAQADLRRLLSGATNDQLAAAQAQLEAAQAQAKIAQDGYNSISNARSAVQDLRKDPPTLPNGQKLHLGSYGLADMEVQLKIQLNAADAQVAAAQAALNKLWSGPTSPEIRSAQARVAAAEGQLKTAQAQYNLLAAGPSREQIAAADAALAQAQETLRTYDVQADRLVVHAPQDGIVMVRNLEVGEVVGPGATVFVLGRLDTVQLTVYLPEDSYGQVKLGQVARVTVDSYPGTTFPASVAHIADQAEFTPRNVQTTEGRRTTVYAIKLDVPNPDGKLKPGMPADVTFGESGNPAVK